MVEKECDIEHRKRGIYKRRNERVAYRDNGKKARVSF